MQDEQLREDAKQLLRVAYEQRSVRGAEGMQVDLAEAATDRGLTHGSPHLDALVDYMEVTGWVEEDPTLRSIVSGHLVRRIMARGLEVLRETPELSG
jgi:hypothetical protein